MIGAVLVTCIVVLTIRKGPIRRLESNGNILLTDDAEVLFENDEYSYKMKDGNYTIELHISPKDVDRLLRLKPKWAVGDWRDGRNYNLAKQLNIPVTGSLISIIGGEGQTFKILTIDRSTMHLYFEMKAY